MKFLRLALSFISFVLGAAASAQTNTFPSSGNVGIGTTSPGDKLQVIGNVGVINNTNFAAGSNMVKLASGSTPQLFYIRSTTTWADTWWDWTMGTDNKLRLGFSTVPQLTLQNGALGLGTDAPLNRLHIADGDVRVSRSSGSWGPNMFFDATGVGSGGTTWGIGSTTAADLAGAGKLVFFHNGNMRVAFDSSGNVGIGTTSPNNRLVVSSGPSARTQVTLSDTNSASLMLRAGAQLPGVVASDVDLQFRAGATWTDADAGGVTAVTIKSVTGNVGIGTTNPTQKLSVAGTIRAKEVIVDTGWSDYVFDDSYRLVPLSEVESHIKANKHLPGIPSAAEVAEHGVSMGDMQSRLLAKVEELTLHLIELKKENDSLKTRVAKLETATNP